MLQLEYVYCNKSSSSSWLGLHPFTVKTRVQVPLETRMIKKFTVLKNNILEKIEDSIRALKYFWKNKYSIIRDLTAEDYEVIFFVASFILIAFCWSWSALFISIIGLIILFAS